MMAERSPRHALRRPLAIQTIILAHSKRTTFWLQIAAIIALSYVYGFRVPSELLTQSTADKWHISPKVITYGPIRRKNRPRPVTLVRSCICGSAPALCPHPWSLFIKTHLPASESFVLTGARFNQAFQQLHTELGSTDVQGWTSHAMRRGMALDVLDDQGFGAMLKAGDWHGGGAFAYASRDKVEQRLIGEMFAFHSDDEA